MLFQTGPPNTTTMCSFHNIRVGCESFKRIFLKFFLYSCSTFASISIERTTGHNFFFVIATALSQHHLTMIQPEAMVEGFDESISIKNNVHLFLFTQLSEMATLT
mmetsp:Transcript_5221/g.7984  ORF Transcript_5221/g.7984 Transcript_5221/m.7984 type:complete len:105 (+) Transcript_5221:1352-1666(+)